MKFNYFYSVDDTVPTHCSVIEWKNRFIRYLNGIQIFNCSYLFFIFLFNIAELNDKQYCRAPRVAILVSPSFEQFLQLYWDVEYVKEGDWIGLFKQDPQSGRETFPVYTIKVQNTTGFISTNITVHRKVERKLKFKSECLGYWAVYFTNNGTGNLLKFSTYFFIYKHSCSQ